MNLFSLLTALSMAAPVPVRDTKPPTGPAPEIRVVTNVEVSSGSMIVQQVVQKAVPVTVQKIVDNGGVKMTVTVTEYKYVREVVQQLHDLSGYKAYTAGGAEVAAKDLPGKVQKGTVVLLSTNSEKVDPAYLKLFRDDTLVLIPLLVPPKK